MGDTTDFCPTLPHPYEALVRRLMEANTAFIHAERRALRTGDGVHCVAAENLNHAAAEAEHQLRVALLAALGGRAAKAAAL